MTGAAGWPPACALGDGFEHRQVFRAACQQLPAQCQRVLLGRVGDLVDEALEVDRVVVEVDAAPETGPYRRIAHRVVDQQVGDRVAQRAFSPGQVQALEDDRILAVLHVLRKQASQDRLARDAHVQRCQPAFVVEPGLELALSDRVVETVLHVFFAGPDQLDRCAGQRFGDLHRLAHPVGGTAPAEAAAKMDLVDLALRDRQARGFGRGGGR